MYTELEGMAPYECLILVSEVGLHLFSEAFFFPLGIKKLKLKGFNTNVTHCRWSRGRTSSVCNRIESRELRRSLGAVSCSVQFIALSLPMCFTWTVLTLTNKLKYRAGQADILTVQLAIGWVKMFIQKVHLSQYMTYIT